MFMKGVETLEACDEHLGRPAAGGNTHPPAAERAALLRSVLERLTAPRDPEGNVPLALRKLDHVFVWVRTHALAGMKQSLDYGLVPHERVSLRLLELAERPGIVGLRVDPARVERVGDELARRFA